HTRERPNPAVLVRSLRLSHQGNHVVWSAGPRDHAGPRKTQNTKKSASGKGKTRARGVVHMRACIWRHYDTSRGLHKPSGGHKTRDNRSRRRANMSQHGVFASGNGREGYLCTFPTVGRWRKRFRFVELGKVALVVAHVTRRMA